MESQPPNSRPQAHLAPVRTLGEERGEMGRVLGLMYYKILFPLIQPGPFPLIRLTLGGQE